MKARLSPRGLRSAILCVLLVLLFSPVRHPASAGPGRGRARAPQPLPAWTTRGGQEQAWYGHDVGTAGYLPETVDVRAAHGETSVQDFVLHTLKLRDLAATPGGDQITIAWETEAEASTVGFNVWRLHGLDQVYDPVNRTLIEARGGPGGASYLLVDRNVWCGPTFHYWLEDVDQWGRTTWHGPVSSRVAPTCTYLPVVFR